MKIITRFFILLIFQGCASAHEGTMPYRNLAYSGERIFPVQNNDASTIFRVWLNNGTSIDRIITVSRDSIFRDQGFIVEVGILIKKGVFKTENRKFYNEIKAIPKSGFDSFFKEIDSLNLFSFKNQKDFSSAFDTPFSVYIVEYKNGGKYNQFSFRTAFPDKDYRENEYRKIEDLLFKEFDWKFYRK